MQTKMFHSEHLYNIAVLNTFTVFYIRSNFAKLVKGHFLGLFPLKMIIFNLI